MVRSALVIRSETEADAAGIRRVVGEAFGGEAEADLVDGLRRDGDLVLSLVACQGEAIIGHVGLSRLVSPARSLALAPLAVRAQSRRNGVGAALVRAAIEQARAQGHDLVFVLGEPAYYGRFGMSAAAAAAYPCRYAGEHFMALHLGDRVPDPRPVIYASAFDGLGSSAKG